MYMYMYMYIITTCTCTSSSLQTDSVDILCIIITVLIAYSTVTYPSPPTGHQLVSIPSLIFIYSSFLCLCLSSVNHFSPNLSASLLLCTFIPHLPPSIHNSLSIFSLQKRGGLKGHVDLNNVKVVEKVLDTAFDKPSFQVVHGELTLYVITNDETEQENWIHLIRQCK